MSYKMIEIPEGLQTRAFCLGDGAIEFLPDFLKTYFPGMRPWIIADGNTWEVAGKSAFDLLKNAGLDVLEPKIFPGHPRLHPDYDISKKLAESMPVDCVPVAVGSGVINDLVKCASGIKGLRYCCVPTACSVDGYTSMGGSMSVNGFKMTIKCPPPYGICADATILRTAPSPMFGSGYADLLAKIPAGADWIIADILGIEPISKPVWALIQHKLRQWVSDVTNMGNVFQGLAATGYGMQMYNESRPASGAEHLFSHIWEMEGLQFEGEDVSHGYKVGVGSLASTILQEYVLKHDYEELEPRMKPGLNQEQRIAEINKLLERGCYGTGSMEKGMSKFLTGDKLAERRALIKANWKKIQDGIRGQIYSFQVLREMMRKANCPVTPAQIGLDREQFLHGIKAAQIIRNRYSIIDLLYELGLLEDAMRDLEQMM